MLKFSDPVRYCSTAIGRFLLEWYCNYEGCCCFLAAYKRLLPHEWRQENIRIRQNLAIEEYPSLSQKDRKPRLLDDLWPQLWGLTSVLNDILATIPQLKTMKGRRRTELAANLESEFRRFYRDFVIFTNSSPVVEVLQPLRSLDITAFKHSICCPLPPFVPHFFEYPPAGVFHLVIQCLKTWMRFTLYPSLRSELDFEVEVLDLEDHDAMSHSFELCRTFAGIEHQFDDNPAILFPCFAPMTMAAVSCPPNVRPWMSSKLRHFEEQGQICSDALKKNLAVLWNIPEIAIEGFVTHLFENPSDASVVSERHEITVGLADANLNHEEGNAEESGLESLTQLRGMFPLQGE